jgi:hypothetical protein
MNPGNGLNNNGCFEKVIVQNTAGSVNFAEKAKDEQKCESFP